MSLIPRDFSLSIVAFGMDSPSNKIDFIATGFVYSQLAGQDESGSRLYATCFVTNRHVVEGQDKLVVRLGDPKSSTYDLQGQWTVHPDPKVDVAVAPFPLDDITGNAQQGLLVCSGGFNKVVQVGARTGHFSVRLWDSKSAVLVGC